MPDIPPSDAAAPPASPYGPVDDAVPRAPQQYPAAPAPAPVDSVGVERGRRILRVAILITGIMSVVGTIVLIVMAMLGIGTAGADISGSSSAVLWALVFGAPMMFVVAINLLIWRALLRGLARRSRSEAIVFVVLIALCLAVASVMLVTTLLFIGFFAGALTSF